MIPVQNRITAHVSLILLLLFLATGCSMETPELSKLKESDVAFTTEPSPPKAGVPAKFHLTVAGMTSTEDVDVSFELKPEGSERNELFTAMQYQPGKYESTITFKQPGKYELTLHVQTIEVHHAFVRELTVTP